MKSFVRFCTIIIGCFAFLSINAAVEVHDSVVGYWQTMDPQTHKADSIVRIWQNRHGAFEGKIVKIFAENGHKSTDVCKVCKRQFKDKPILGMHIIWGFEKTGPDFYTKGHILDPTSGDIYKCHMTLTHQGNTLDVHGYIGVPLFGRSVTWYRVHPLG